MKPAPPVSRNRVEPFGAWPFALPTCKIAALHQELNRSLPAAEGSRNRQRPQNKTREHGARCGHGRFKQAATSMRHEICGRVSCSGARVRSARTGIRSHQRPDRRLVGVRDALAQRTEQRDRVDVPATTMHQFTAFTF